MDLLLALAPIVAAAGLYFMFKAAAAFTSQNYPTALLFLKAGAICLGVAAALSDVKEASKKRQESVTNQPPSYGQPGNYANSNTGGPVNQNGNAGQINSNSPQRLPPGTYLIDGQIVVVANTTSTGTSNGLAVESGASSTMVSR